MVEWMELLTVRAETEAMMKSKVAKPLFDRQSHELEKTREELSKAEAELHRLREELTHSRTQKEKIHSQVAWRWLNDDIITCMCLQMFIVCPSIYLSAAAVEFLPRRRAGRCTDDTRRAAGQTPVGDLRGAAAEELRDAGVCRERQTEGAVQVPH